MISITGAQTEAIVYSNELEASAREQLQRMVNHEAFTGLPVRVMPDVHAGKGSVVGFTCKLGEKLIPNVIGVDIGCGVRLDSIRSRPGSWTFEGLDKVIRKEVPSGMAVRQKEYVGLRNPNSKIGELFGDIEEKLLAICKHTGQDPDRVIRSIGSLGGGNHYLEVGKSAQGDFSFSIHCGSRNFGLQIAEFYQRKAMQIRNTPKGEESQLAWIDGDEAQQYAHDMSVAQAYASLNRLVILEVVARALGWEVGESFAIESVHNYIDFSEGFIRKGAISAAKGKQLVIPISMAEGVIIGRGKGCAEWNISAPHGAGRLMSRSQAKASLNMKEYKSRMEGVWTSCVSTKTIDEAPMAYKGLEHILSQIGDSVDVIDVVKPVYNFKAGE